MRWVLDYHYELILRLDGYASTTVNLQILSPHFPEGSLYPFRFDSADLAGIRFVRVEKFAEDNGFGFGLSAKHEAARVDRDLVLSTKRLVAFIRHESGGLVEESLQQADENRFDIGGAGGLVRVWRGQQLEHLTLLA